MLGSLLATYLLLDYRLLGIVVTEPLVHKSD